MSNTNNIELALSLIVKAYDKIKDANQNATNYDPRGLMVMLNDSAGLISFRDGAVLAVSREGDTATLKFIDPLVGEVDVSECAATFEAIVTAYGDYVNDPEFDEAVRLSI